jgi:hypothetical protein
MLRFLPVCENGASLVYSSAVNVLQKVIPEPAREVSATNDIGHSRNFSQRWARLQLLSTSQGWSEEAIKSSYQRLLSPLRGR